MHHSLARIHNHHKRLNDNWIDQCKNDPELGGTQFHRNLRLAKQAVHRLGGHKLRQVLEQSGMGSHPEIVRAFLRAGHAMNNGKAPPHRIATAQDLYPGFNP